MRTMLIAMIGFLAAVCAANAARAAEGLTDERLAQIADTVFARFDSDKSDGLSQSELASANTALHGQIESLARRALGSTRVKASELLGDATQQPALDGAGEVSADSFRQYVAAMYQSADRQVRAMHQRRASQYEQQQREARSREYERYGDAPLRREPYGAGDEWRWQREREMMAREQEARVRGETGRRQEGQGGSEEQRRREAAQMEEQRRQMERAREMQLRQQREAQARAQQQQQQARPPQPAIQRSPFSRPQPGGATFKDRLRGKK